MQIYYGWHFVAFFEMTVALFGTFWPYAWHFLSPTSWQPWEKDEKWGRFSMTVNLAVSVSPSLGKRKETEDHFHQWKIVEYTLYYFGSDDKMRRRRRVAPTCVVVRLVNFLSFFLIFSLWDESRCVNNYGRQICEIGGWIVREAEFCEREYFHTRRCSLLFLSKGIEADK